MPGPKSQTLKTMGKWDPFCPYPNGTPGHFILQITLQSEIPKYLLVGMALDP